MVDETLREVRDQVVVEERCSDGKLGFLLAASRAEKRATMIEILAETMSHGWTCLQLNLIHLFRTWLRSQKLRDARGGPTCQCLQP